MNQLRNFVVPEECNQLSVKSFVRHHLGISSRALIKQKYMDNGILCNGQHCKTIQILQTGDVLSFLLPTESPDYVEIPGELNILYEDDNFLAVNKPANMPVHPSPGHDRDSLLNIVAYYYKTQQEPHLFRPLYRLDKDTTGVIWIAKNRIASSSTIVEKTYYGICQGVLSGSGTIDAPIALMEGSKIKREIGQRGIMAITNWKVCKSHNEYTLVAFQLPTGRTHQIRAHMEYIGFPLAGDDLYGGDINQIDRQALHCGKTHLSCKVYETDIIKAAKFPDDMCSSFEVLVGSVFHNGGLTVDDISG